MSLYNALFGMNPLSELLLATLGLRVGDVGRFRDCFISEGQIAVYTRNGGGNRACWNAGEEKSDSENCACPGCTIQYRLRKHPQYLTDRDDDFDCTYATIYFRFPSAFADDLKRLDQGEKFDPDERWQKALEAIRSAP